MGSNALYSNRTAFANTAIGYGALFNNTGEDFALGAGNTAIGFEALYNNTTGNSNIAFGGYAGWNRTTGDYNIDIGNAGVAGEANTIRIGDESVNEATFVAGIWGVGVSGDTVVVDANGQLGTAAAGSPLSLKEVLAQRQIVQQLKAATERQAATIVLQEEQIKAVTASLKQQVETVIAKFEATERQQQTQIEALSSALRKVSARLELNKPAPQVALDSQ